MLRLLGDDSAAGEDVGRETMRSEGVEGREELGGEGGEGQGWTD
jgi:hypothetical protein